MINNNSYELELPPRYNMSPTFNIGDLSPFHIGVANVWLHSLQKEEDDEFMTPHEVKKALSKRIIN